MGSEPVRIAVIIPFFQREAGLLARALRSIAEQQFQARQVIVVDDGSPRPARSEIEEFLADGLLDVTLVEQRNQGVAAARNAGLARVADDITVIAFLDSDDFYAPSHLATAAWAFERGADFFFSDLRREEDESTGFGNAISRLMSHSVEIDHGSDTRRWIGSVGQLMVPVPPFVTSTVLYRRSICPALRFPTGLRRAGEDGLAWWQLVVAARSVCFSIHVEVVYGRGVSIWSSSRFGTPESLVKLADEIVFRRRVICQFPLTYLDERVLREAVNERRDEALASWVHLVRRGVVAREELAYLVRSDPICLARWMVRLPGFILGWMRGSRSHT